jgi:antitoxin ParD1/3/4
MEKLMNAERLSITLPADMAQRIRRRVESGSYSSNSEVIRDALRMFEDREAEREERLQSIRAKINAAADDPHFITD